MICNKFQKNSINQRNAFCSVLLCTVVQCTILYCTLLYCPVLYCTVLYCIEYCTVLNFTLHYCTVLYYNVLHCTVLNYTVWFYEVQDRPQSKTKVELQVAREKCASVQYSRVSLKAPLVMLKTSTALFPVPFGPIFFSDKIKKSGLNNAHFKPV